jgi:capsid assembly protease
MKILDILNEPWLILPDKLRTIQDIYVTHLHGEKLSKDDLNALVAKAKTQKSESGRYEINLGTAIIPVHGVIAKRLDLMTAISGGLSTQDIRNSFDEAIGDPAISAIMLDMDSPGGTVDGTQELANAIFQARGKKPIVAFTDGTMASAAYWIGSAADRVYINGDTTWVGSIGVVTSHLDISKWEEQKGYKTTEITAGKYKRLVSEYAPLTEEGRAELQERVNTIYDLFTGEVARFRGLEQERIKATEAKIYLGKEAIKARLADGVSTKDRLLSKIAKNPQTFIRREQVEAMLQERRNPDGIDG